MLRVINVFVLWYNIIFLQTFYVKNVIIHYNVVLELIILFYHSMTAWIGFPLIIIFHAMSMHGIRDNGSVISAWC